jgi:hypothetical protein
MCLQHGFGEFNNKSKRGGGFDDKTSGTVPTGDMVNEGDKVLSWLASLEDMTREMNVWVNQGDRGENICTVSEGFEH